MKIAVWKTGHQIADTISCYLTDAVKNSSLGLSVNFAANLGSGLPEADVHIGYGILRGMTEVFRECIKQDKAIFLLDNGYWGAGHFHGMYRINYLGTQSQYNSNLQKPHNLSLDYPEQNTGDVVLIVPPTDAVKQFFGLNKYGWLVDAINKYGRNNKYIVRAKGSTDEIDWKKIKGVVTFNSTLGVEALKRGVPVISDTEHSMIGSYYKQMLVEKGLDYNFENVMKIGRDELFNCMNYHQFTLDEIREGKAWELFRHYLNQNS